MRYALVQKLMVEGAELDMGLFQKLTYVETLDLSGPRLLLEASDSDRILRDDALQYALDSVDEVSHCVDERGGCCGDTFYQM